MIDRTIIAFKRYLVQRGLREKLKSLVLLGKIIHNIGRALSLL